MLLHKTWLPSETPAGIKELREKDLKSVRGNGEGERKPHERIYDYDIYNDIGDPRKKDRVRPILGVPERPYPRRCRSGRPLLSTGDQSLSLSLTLHSSSTKTLFWLLTWWIHSDTPFESRGKDKDEFYVPRDEVFEDIKRDTFRAGRFKALFHNLVPSIAAALSNLDIPFTCFSDIDRLYKSDIVLKHTEGKDKGLGGFIDGILNVSETLLRYDTPAVIKCKFCSFLNLYHHSWSRYIMYFYGLFVQGTDLRGWGTMSLDVKLLLVSTLSTSSFSRYVLFLLFVFTTKGNYI